MSKKNFESSFTSMLLKAGDNELASLAEEETLSTTTEFIHTGSYALNGLISGDIYKGIPNNKIVCLCGEEATGKTFVCLQTAREAIKMGYLVVYFDSENATDKEAMQKMGIDTKKVLYFPVDTIENFRDQAVRIVNAYNEEADEKKPKLFFILDSLGALSSKKEIKDIESGNDKADMTKGKVVKSIFRVLGLKMAEAKIPMLITCHVYDSQGSYIPEKVMASGSGPKYAASMIMFLSRQKARDEDKNISGLILTATSWKNRFCKPFAKVKLMLDFNNGLHQYYGLQGDKKSDASQSLTNFCEPSLTKESISGNVWTLNGKKITTQDLLSDHSYWSSELLDMANANLAKEFKFGSDTDKIVDDPEQ